MVASKNRTGIKNGTGAADKVRLESVSGRLRLRWSGSGKRHCLSLGLPDTKSNRLAAQKIILQVEADLETGKFYELAHYKRQMQSAGAPAAKLTAVEIFDKWLEYKATHVSKRTIDWYGDTRKNLVTFFQDRPAEETDKNAATAFFVWLKSQPLKPETQQRRLEAVAAAWKWAVEENITPVNPWGKISKLVDVPDIEKARPFTKEERAKILEAIREIRPESNFEAFVKFMLGCGTRPGEAIGLRWGDISDNFRKVTIRSQFTKGERKAPKKNKIRKFTVSSEIQGLLQQLVLNAGATDVDKLVFSHNGFHINLDSFREDVWKPALEKAGVTYRPPKNCRHTFVSTMLAAAVNPVLVAEITGHNTEVMFKNYAGLLNEPAIPDF